RRWIDRVPFPLRWHKYRVYNLQRRLIMPSPALLANLELARNLLRPLLQPGIDRLYIHAGAVPPRPAPGMSISTGGGVEVHMPVVGVKVRGGTGIDRNHTLRVADDE